MIKENSIDIIDDLKRMIRSLNENERIEFFNFLKDEEKNYVILTKNENDKINDTLNEAYLKGFDEGFLKGKNSIKDSKSEIKNQIENIDKTKIEKQILNLIKCFHI